MEKAVITGERRAEIVEAPDPEPQADWALVKVHAAPMCTEYKDFLAGHPRAFLGHEAAGEVAAVAQEGPVRPGDRVVVQPQYSCGVCALCVAGDHIHCEDGRDVEAFTGSPEGCATYAQYLLKPARLLSPIPDDIPYARAALALCALGPSFGAFHAMNLGAFDTVLITGAGPVGLGAVVNARFRGARILVAESIPWRAERARALGADEVFDPAADGCLERIRERTGGRGADKSLDCSGAPAAHRLCIDATRRRGAVAFVGECERETPVRVSPDLIRKGLTLIGSWHYNLSLFPHIMDVIRRSRAAETLISHELPMRRIQEAFEISASHECAKIILNPWA